MSTSAPESTTTPSPPHWAVAGHPTGTVRSPCVKDAATSADWPGAREPGASSEIESTRGFVSAASQPTLSAVVGSSPTSPTPGSMPSIVHPVNPPVAGVPAGSFPELPLIR